MDTVMDVKLCANKDWKTVQYKDASAILPTTRDRTASFSRAELAGIVADGKKPTESHDKSSSDSDMDDENCVELTSSEENTDKYKYSVANFTFINRNARSLGPKIESLFDCMHEKEADVALLTETWYQRNRDRDEEL